MQKKEKKIFAFDLHGKEAIFEINSIPLRAERSVLCRYGDTTVLTALCTKDLEKKPDFLRLTVFVEEKFYSIGKIPSGFGKREGRPGYESILIARLIDRSLRSCLPLEDKKEIQITNTILSLGDSNEPRLAAFWNSIIVCLLSEELNIDKLISMVVLAENEGSVICNPTSKQLEKSSFEIVVIASTKKIIALEICAREISEKDTEKFINIAQLEITKTIEECFATLLTDDLLQKKRDVKSIRAQNDISESVSLNVQVSNQIKSFLEETIGNESLLWDTKKSLLEEFPSILSRAFPEVGIFEIEQNYSELLESKLGEWMKTNSKRIDGRKFDQIREISMGIDYVPVVHGSSFFSRGNTSVISALTFGKGGDRQNSDDTLSRGPSKSFIHHYNFPSFAVNGLSSIKSVSRREIGHGQLAEKTFFRLLPNTNEFPYTTRVVSEVVSSEGSSSQASVCASSLAMMAAGFPLNRHVAGISLGLIAGNVLTDINDFEDKFGEIDFKVAGTEFGICSLQMDVKNEGIDSQLLSRCLEQGKIARTSIIELMNDTIKEPRKQLSSNIMKFQKIYIGVDKIGLVIGPRGKNIDLVTSTTGARVDIKDDGFAFIYHADQDKLSETVEMIRRLIVR